MKKEFICVQPKSRKAKNRFANELNGLNSCRIEAREKDQVFLASISGKYFFWMKEDGNDDWEVIR